MVAQRNLRVFDQSVSGGFGHPSNQMSVTQASRVLSEDEAVRSPGPRPSHASRIEPPLYLAAGGADLVPDENGDDPATNDDEDDERKADSPTAAAIRNAQVPSVSEDDDGFGDITIPDDLLTFAFSKACKEESWKETRAYLKRGKERNLFDVDTPDSMGFTPLALATRGRNTDVIRGLLKFGAKPNAVSKGGLTPLHLAVALPDSDNLVSLLLTGGCDPDIATEDGTTSVHLAALSGKAAILELLLGPQGNGDPNSQRQSAGGSTPLYAAAFGGHSDAAAMLLKYGALVDLPKVGQQPLPHVVFLCCP